MTQILFLDDDLHRAAGFHSKLKPGSDYAIWSISADEAIRILSDSLSIPGNQFDVVHLDHDLNARHYAALAGCDGTDCGCAVARHIAAMPIEKKPIRVIVHTWNPHGAEKMMAILREGGVACEYRRFE